MVTKMQVEWKIRKKSMQSKSRSLLVFWMVDLNEEKVAGAPKVGALC